MPEFRSERVLLTGATGFLGRYVLDALRSSQASTFAPARSETDLLDRTATETMVRSSFSGAGPTILINCAGYSGGLGANRKHPARFFYDNLAIGMNLIEGLRRAGFAQQCALVQLGNMVVYPAGASQPYREESLFTGKPDPDVAAYALAKLALLQMMEAYATEHGQRGVYVIPSNLYGPGDTFDPERSHAVGAMVRRFVSAVKTGASEVVCWGTGSPLRDFVYVEDAAKGVVLAAKHAAGLGLGDPVEVANLASGHEVSIKVLAEAIARQAGFSGKVVWDASKWDGVARRALSPDKAREVLGWRATTELQEALGNTVAYYRSSHP